jgi:hypothetical protein
MKRILINSRRVVGVLLTIALVVTVVSCKKKKSLDSFYNYELGIKHKEVIDNAQYLPDPADLVNSNNIRSYASIIEDNKEQELISPFGFESIIYSMSNIDTLSGSGKYLGYDIYELKEEVSNIIAEYPIYNQWFRLDYMREKEGFISIPYYESYAYKLEYDDVKDILTVNSICWHTRSSYLDFTKRKTVENYNENESIIQLQAKELKFYSDEDGNEVVECSVYMVGIDHYNRDSKSKSYSFIPYEYLFLKNVENKSVTRYHIVATERYRPEDSFDDGGMDISHTTPYGTNRDFVNIEYVPNESLKMIRINQIMPTSFYNLPATTSVIYYDNEGTRPTFFHDAFDQLLPSDTYLDIFDPFKVPNSGLKSTYLMNVLSSNYNLGSYQRRTSGSPVSGDTVTRSDKYLNTSKTKEWFSSSYLESILSLGSNLGVPSDTVSNHLTNLSNGDIYDDNSIDNENALKVYLDDISKSVVDNFSLKNNWDKIFNDSEFESSVVKKKGPFIDTKLYVTGISNLVSITSTYISFNVTADVPTETLLDTNKEYSLSLGLKSETGEVTIVGTSYDTVEEVPYNGAVDGSTYLRFKGSDGYVSIDNILLTKEGVYTLGIYLTELDSNGNDVIILDTLINAYLGKYTPIEVESVYEDGKFYNYSLSGNGKKLVITVTVS